MDGSQRMWLSEEARDRADNCLKMLFTEEATGGGGGEWGLPPADKAHGTAVEVVTSVDVTVSTAVGGMLLQVRPWRGR